ncbi:MAG: aldo/keto reductase family oxidoreductase [Alphaproteobacteria bacterium]
MNKNTDGFFPKAGLVWGNMRIFDEASFHKPNQLAIFLEWLIEHDINAFDSADIYGSYKVEEHFGKALSLLSTPRYQYKLITKCSIGTISPQRPENTVKHYNSTAQYIQKSVETSLKNFHTDYVDLLLLHRPDYLMQADETAHMLDRLIGLGKLRNVGVSNFTSSQVNLLQSYLHHPIITNQVEFSPLHLNPLDDGTFDQAQQMHARPMIWSPFAGGQIFTEGKKQNKELYNVLSLMAKKYGADLDTIILSWIMRLPSHPVPVIGSNKKERILKALKTKDIIMDIQDWYAVLEAAQGFPVP